MSHKQSTLLHTDFAEVRLHEADATGLQWTDAFRVESPRIAIGLSGLIAVRQGKRQLLGQPIQALVIDDSSPYIMRRYGAASISSWVLIPHQTGLHTASKPLHLTDWLALRDCIALATQQSEGLALEEYCAALFSACDAAQHVHSPRAIRLEHLAANVREYLALHLHERLPLMQIAQAVNVSVFHLTRLFKQATGMTIHSALLALRITQAVQRLELGQKDLSQLALDIGFNSHAHFSWAFRKAVGCTPSDWRSRQGAHRAIF